MQNDTGNLCMKRPFGKISVSASWHQHRHRHRHCKNSILVLRACFGKIRTLYLIYLNILPCAKLFRIYNFLFIYPNVAFMFYKKYCYSYCVEILLVPASMKRVFKNFKNTQGKAVVHRSAVY